MFTRAMFLRLLVQVAFLLIAGMGMFTGPVRAQRPSAAPTDPAPTSAPAAVFVSFEADLSGVEDGSSSVGDVNNDGHLDLVITGSGSATLYLGDGQGGFTEAATELKGVGLGTSSSFGDVNNDGNLDLLVTGDSNADGQLPVVEPSATLYLGDGQGGFTRANAGLAGVFQGSSSFGDVDDDGNLDLVLTGWGTGDAPMARLYRGDGEGGFTETEAELNGVAQSASSFGDVNGDGHLDLLLAGWDTSGTPSATLCLGDGAGGFTEARANLLGVGSGPYDEAAASSSFGDVNGDGHLDLVVTGRDPSNTPTATLYPGDGQGGFTATEAGFGGVEDGSSSFGDLNGDGNLDLLITGADASGTPTATLYLGDGTGDFARADVGLGGVRNSSSSLGDVDNDGDLDLLITGADASGTPTATLYENRAADYRLGASAAEAVAGDGTVDFGATGVDLRFSATTGAGTVTVRKFDTPPSSTQGIPEDHVSDFRFTIDAGEGLTVGAGTEVHLDVGTLAGIGHPTSVRVYRRSVAGNGPFTALPTAFGTDANELVATTDSLGEFVLAWNARWVRFESFGGAEVDEGVVRLTWTTAREMNNLGFDVERQVVSRADAPSWTKIEFVQGAGTTAESQTYRFTDADVPFTAEAVRYRLRRVAPSGTVLLGEPVTVTMEMPEELQLHAPFPNPARSQATLRYELPRAMEIEIAMYDVLGRRVATLVEVRLDAGRREVQLGTQQLSRLASGTYFVRLVAGEQTRIRRLTVVR